MQCFICQLDPTAVGQLETVTINQATKGADNLAQVQVCAFCAEELKVNKGAE